MSRSRIKNTSLVLFRSNNRPTKFPTPPITKRKNRGKFKSPYPPPYFFSHHPKLTPTTQPHAASNPNPKNNNGHNFSYFLRGHGIDRACAGSSAHPSLPIFPESYDTHHELARAAQRKALA